MDNNTKANRIRDSEDFKTQVIGVYKSGVYPTVAECAKAYQISSNTLHGWLARDKAKYNPVVIATSAEHAELVQLRKDYAKSQMENDILKKAAIYFANQTR